MNTELRALWFIGAMSLASLLRAQPQLENAGFEEWNDLGTATEEPVEWSSVKTSDGGSIINGFAPQLCWQDPDAHTGSYSVNLRTVTSIAGAAAGLLTNGRVHAEFTVSNSHVFTDLDNAQWNTVCGSRPDSLIGWFKAAPEPGDHAKITALMHVGAGKLPRFDTYPNWVGTAVWTGPEVDQAEWTRFSVPFVYLDERMPEHVLLAVSCGDSTNSIVGTEAWFDDMGLVYNLYTTPDAAIAYVNAGSGFDLNVDYTTSGEPVAATDFTVELSDENGDFSAPTVIGMLNSTSADGSIPCTIPAGTLPGANYLIRVVTPSQFYAPVVAGIVVEVNTSVVAIGSNDIRVRVVGEVILLDLGAHALDGPSYQLYDISGALLASGRLLSGGVNVLPVTGVHGVLVLRVSHGKGNFIQRIVVP